MYSSIKNLHIKRCIRKHATVPFLDTKLWSLSVTIHQDINHKRQVLLQNRFRLECFNLCWFVSSVTVTMTKLTTTIGPPRVHCMFYCYHSNMGATNSNLKRKVDKCTNWLGNITMSLY